MTTKETIKAIEKMEAGEKLVLHNCSMCGYPCGFLIIDSQLHYDSGCDCTTYEYNIEPRELEELTKYTQQESLQIKWGLTG